MKTVILHGLGQTPRDWDAVIDQALSVEIDCPALFPPGAAGPVTYPRVLSDLEAKYADTVEPLRLCGLSLGAVLALDHTLRHPDKVNSLILIAGQFRSPTHLIDLQNLIFRCLPESMFQSMGLSKRDTIQLARSMRALDFRGRLHQVTCPVTVVCGERDRANLRAAQKLTALLPQAELRVIPGAGHAVNRDAPAAISQILNR